MGSRLHKLDEAPTALTAHLRQWLGLWPPAHELHVVASAERVKPGWDGQMHPALGIADASGAAVLSVQPSAAGEVRRQASTGLDSILERLPAQVGAAGRSTYRAVFRWTTAPADLPELGVWVRADDAGVPAWLRPFGGEVLIATDRDGTHLGGVGLKRHDEAGHELAVVIAPDARGHGVARALVAQAARHVLGLGAVPTYMHDPDNEASARVAEAAGFPDLGWSSFGLSELPPGSVATE